jgi:hypothetical protein
MVTLRVGRDFITAPRQGDLLATVLVEADDDDPTSYDRCEFRRATATVYLILLSTNTTPPSGRSLRMLSGTCTPDVSLLTCSLIR